MQLMGLAVYNSIILDIHFPPCCYKKLLSPAIMPRRGSTPVGMLPDLGLHDLIQAMPVCSSYHSHKLHFRNGCMIYKNFKQPRDIWISCYVEVVLVTQIFILDGFCSSSWYRGKIDFQKWMDNLYNSFLDVMQLLHCLLKLEWSVQLWMVRYCVQFHPERDCTCTTHQLLLW